MSIIIKGMEMPKLYRTYKVRFVEAEGGTDGSKILVGIANEDSTAFRPIGEAVELPPHGDLIQRSDVLAVVDDAYEYGDVIERKDFDENNIPAVVPAERSDT